MILLVLSLPRYVIKETIEGRKQGMTKKILLTKTFRIIYFNLFINFNLNFKILQLISCADRIPYFLSSFFNPNR